MNRDSDVLWILCSAAGRPRPSCRRRARAPDHTYCVMAVRMSPDSTIAVRFVFDNMSTENRAFAARPQCGVRMASQINIYSQLTPVRVLCNGRNDMSTGYGLTIFKIFYFILYKIVEAAMPVTPYENLTAVACPRTDSSRKGRYGQSSTGFV